MGEVKLGTEKIEKAVEGLVEGAKAIKTIRDIVKDGIDSSDLPKAIGLLQDQLSKIDLYKEAFSDLDLAKDELKDLDSQEVMRLFVKVLDGVKEVEKV